MKKVIDGKVYNTETAELVHDWNNGRFPNDFKFREKQLYRTKKGNWFIKHLGGAMTDMAVSVGNNATGGSSDIEPISSKDAMKFLETHGGEEALEKYFADELEEA